MARENGARENQHYVPKLVLRNFAGPGRKPSQRKIWAFDKSDSSLFVPIFATLPLNAASPRSEMRVLRQKSS